MRRIVAIAGVLAVALLVGVVVVTSLVLSPKFAGQQLQAAVLKATGRTLVIDKAPSLTFWPELSVELEGARLSNPPGMYDGQFAKMERLRLRIGARALLARRLDVREVTLVRPQLELLVDKNGRANWDFGNAGGGQASGDGSTSAVTLDSVSVAPVVIEDGEVRYLDERSGAAFAVSKVNVTLSLANPQSPLEARGNLVWNGEPVSLSTLYVRSPTRLMSQGSPVDIAITSPQIDFSFSGRARFADGFSLAGKINVETQSIRELSRWAGKPLPPGGGLGPFSARAGLDLNGSSIALNKAVIGLDGMNAQGDLRIVLGGVRPLVTASLGIDRINVNAYLRNGGKRDGKGDPASGGSREWSNAPMDFSGLRAVDAKLVLSTSRIEYGDVMIGASSVNANLKNGVLDANLKKMAFYRGNAAGRIVLNGRSERAVIQGALTATDLNGYELLKDFADFTRIAGKATITLSLAAAGRSQRELVSSLNGKSGFKFTNGAIRGINIPAMVRNVDKAIIGGWEDVPAQDTDFSVLSANFDIKKGIASNPDLLMIGPLVRLKGAGTVDLPGKRLNHKVNPKVVASLEGQGGNKDLQGLAVPVIVRGSWYNPKIYPDVDGILQNPQAAFDALAKMIGGKPIDVNKQKAKVKKAITKIVEDNAGKILDGETKKRLETGADSILKSFIGNN